MSKIPVIVAAKRTPIGSFNGALASFSAAELGSFVIKSVLETSGISANQVDEVIMGNVLNAGMGQAPARQAALKAGLPDKTPATTINKVCSSGLKAVMYAANQIASGECDIIIAGGMESMSNVPFYLPNMRNGQKLGHVTAEDGILKDGLTDAYDNKHMGLAAELCASTYKFSREDQDNYAISSYKKAIDATEKGLFKDEITVVEVKDRKGNVTLVDRDEELARVSFDKIPSLRPVFAKDGTVTAANASSINDGAAALLIMSEEKANELGLPILAKIAGQASAAKEPQWFTTAPSDAVPKALKSAGLSISDIDLFEVNEAFSVVCLANNKELKLPAEKVNTRGGAVSIGHPIGCSGARILVTLLHAMNQQNLKHGVVGICNGGGGATSMVVSR
jgi:acetyl-CoA C-acetyltransferase